MLPRSHSHVPFPTLAALAFLAPLAAAQQTSRLSVGPGGVQSNGDSYDAVPSADGRFVVFSSAADDLVAGDTNLADDIFVRDRMTRTTTLVSVDSSGVQADAGSGSPAISADGRYVAFASFATNLVAGDTNGRWDVFVRDLVAGTTVRVSVDGAGVEGDKDSVQPSISADGRYVAFHSSATNLVAGDVNNANDVFVHDLQTGATVLASVTSAGAQGTRPSTSPSISADGMRVAFTSNAKLVVTDADFVADVYVRDLSAGTTSLVSVDSAGVKGTGGSYNAALSGDGRYVSFASDAANLVAGDTNVSTDIFRHDLLLGTTVLVSATPAGTVGQGQCTKSALSADGRYVAFKSGANDLVPGDDNGTTDIFLRDVVGGRTVVVSTSSAGALGNDFTSQPRISADGRHVTFYGQATNLVANDTNGVWDVFVFSYGKIRRF